MIRILRNKTLPFSLENKDKKEKVVIVDFSPHFLDYLLLTLIPQSKCAHDIAYSLSFKLAKSFEMIYTQLSIESLDLLSFIIKPIQLFVTLVITETQAELPLYEMENQNYAQFVYANVVLANVLLQNGDKDMKIKDSPLALSSTVRNRIIEKIRSDPQSSQSLSHWIQRIL